MKVTVKGVTIEGSEDQVAAVLRAMGEGDGELFYNSTSKGLILIASMNAVHLRNALMVEYEKWLASLKALDVNKLIAAIEEGPTDNKTLMALYKELKGRPAH
jgi:hypothetical protein